MPVGMTRDSLTLAAGRHWPSNACGDALWQCQQMMHNLEENEASLKLAVTYPEFPGNPGSKVNAVERARGREMRKVVDNPVF